MIDQNIVADYYCWVPKDWGTDEMIDIYESKTII